MRQRDKRTFMLRDITRFKKDAYPFTLPIHDDSSPIDSPNEHTAADLLYPRHDNRHLSPANIPSNARTSCGSGETFSLVRQVMYRGRGVGKTPVVIKP